MRDIRYIAVEVEIAFVVGVGCRGLGRCIHFRPIAFIGRCMVSAVALLKYFTPNKSIGSIAPRNLYAGAGLV